MFRYIDDMLCKHRALGDAIVILGILAMMAFVGFIEGGAL